MVVFWIISIIMVAVMVVIMATVPTATATMTTTTVIMAIIIMTTAVASMTVASTLYPRRKTRTFTKGWERMARWSVAARAVPTMGVGAGIYWQRKLLWNSNLTCQLRCISDVCVRAVMGKI